MDVLSNEIFDDLKITNHDTSDFIGSNPNIAKALLTIMILLKVLRRYAKST